jgi:hypothetical protein
MILDMQTMFSGTVAADGTKTGQAITATAISTNVIDRAGGLSSGFPALEDEGTNPDESWLIVQAKTAAAGGDAAKTITITLESAADAGLTSGPVVHASTTAILGSAITAGATLWRIALPSADYKRFIGLRYTVSAGFTSFEMLAFTTADPQRNVIYPTGFAVV